PEVGIVGKDCLIVHNTSPVYLEAIVSAGPLNRNRIGDPVRPVNSKRMSVQKRATYVSCRQHATGTISSARYQNKHRCDTLISQRW
ncbi:MAG: hypothetical protein ACOYXY_09020, partial [Thermodesulfobacteriota bacterium]